MRADLLEIHLLNAVEALENARMQPTADAMKRIAEERKRLLEALREVVDLIYLVDQARSRRALAFAEEEAP